jgi:hypothetical protein
LFLRNNILLAFCVTIGRHYTFLIILAMPPRRTPLPQQVAPSQSQPQPRGSSRSRAPSQSRSRRHQAAIANLPETGEEFDFTSVEHEDTSAVRSNVATANSTPSPSVQVQPVDLPARKGSSRDAVDINHFFLEGNAPDQRSAITLRQLCKLCS